MPGNPAPARPAGAEPPPPRGGRPGAGPAGSRSGNPVDGRGTPHAAGGEGSRSEADRPASFRRAELARAHRSNEGLVAWAPEDRRMSSPAEPEDRRMSHLSANSDNPFVTEAVPAHGNRTLQLWTRARSRTETSP
eukprot:3975122-Pyramimonas_sp.AAC.1